MKIYIVEDKKDEREKGKSAVRKRGHENLRENEFGFLEDFFESMEDFKDGSCAQLDLADIIKDLKESGGGIITDMMFHLSRPLKKDDPIPPSGLLVVIQALAAGVPVVVCTDASEVGGHHAQALHWIFDGYVGLAVGLGKNLPFGWVEDKNWENAVELLEKR